MSSASVTNNFTNGTSADAEQVDQNFADLVSIFNTHAVHKGETALEAKTGSPGLKFQVGQGVISVTASGSAWSLTVTFPVAFSTVPLCFVSSGLGTGGAKKYVLSTDPDTTTTTQMVATACTTDLATPSGALALDFYWLAIGT